MNPQTTKQNIIKDSSSLFRDIIDTAIQSNLKKNELIICMFLMQKLLGYGKGRDAITLSQFDYGINPQKKDRSHSNPKINLRKDHIKTALDAFIKKGIFTRKPHEKYQYEYSIGAEILGDFDGIFFTPTLPKIGKNSPKQENFPENWVHTALDLNRSLSLQIQQRSPVINISTKATMFPISQEEQRCCCSTLKDKQPAKPEPIWKPQWDWETEGLEIPASISQSNHRFCKNNLLKATAQQAKDALTVYHNMWAKGNVNNPPFLLKSLIERAMSDNLALPQSNEIVKIRIPNVPTTLDDSLVVYARKNGFSEPKREAGYDYLAYRKDLMLERELKLKTLNRKASQPVLPAETKTVIAPPQAKLPTSSADNQETASNNKEHYWKEILNLFGDDE